VAKPNRKIKKKTNAMKPGKYNTYTKPQNPIKKHRPTIKSYPISNTNKIGNRINYNRDKLQKKNINGKTFYLNNGHQSSQIISTNDTRMAGCIQPGGGYGIWYGGDYEGEELPPSLCPPQYMPTMVRFGLTDENVEYQTGTGVWRCQCMSMTTETGGDSRVGR